MKFCQYCGSELKEGASFCSNCGGKVSNSENSNKETNTSQTKTTVYPIVENKNSSLYNERSKTHHSKTSNP